jgi:hypothetical protein
MSLLEANARVEREVTPFVTDPLQRVVYARHGRELRGKGDEGKGT